MGFCPLVYDGPYRVTYNYDYANKLFKHTKVVLKGWELHELDKERVRGCQQCRTSLTFQKGEGRREEGGGSRVKGQGNWRR